MVLVERPRRRAHGCVAPSGLRGWGGPFFLGLTPQAIIVALLRSSEGMGGATVGAQGQGVADPTASEAGAPRRAPAMPMAVCAVPRRVVFRFGFTGTNTGGLPRTSCGRTNLLRTAPPEDNPGSTDRRPRFSIEKLPGRYDRDTVKLSQFQEMSISAHDQVRFSR